MTSRHPLRPPHIPSVEHACRTAKETSRVPHPPQTPPVEHALNLCDVVGCSPTATATPQQVFETLYHQVAHEAGVAGFARIYLGSYFCDRLFLSLSDAFLKAAAAFARDTGAHLTLVAPIFGQRTLEAGLTRLEALMAPRDPFDELVVNDPALAHHMAGWLALANPSGLGRPTLVRGRLMVRCMRDPRYGAPQAPVPVPLDARQALAELASWHPALMEVDPFAPVVDASPLEGTLPLALHLPHALLTTGHICRAASIGVDASQAFRPDAPCARQCLGGVDVFECESLARGGSVFLTQQGRSVFFENPGCRVVGARPARIVWSPADFACPAWKEPLAWERF